MTDLVFWIALFGTAVFAVSGALMALRQGMDFIGVSFIATVTGIGGGTFRDVLLGDTPLSWVLDPAPVAVCIGCALVCCLFNRVLLGRRMQWLLYADALGLAMFAALGAQKAELAGAHPLVVVLFGAVSASFGGIIRDVICNEPPVLLRQEIYITAAILGALVYVLIPPDIAFNLRLVAAVGAALGLRLIAIWRGWSLNFPKPLFPKQ
ncbi:MAG: trimeric intracellular cation channel family protein [Alphaproteobacteria bacterium]